MTDLESAFLAAYYLGQERGAEMERALARHYDLLPFANSGELPCACEQPSPGWPVAHVHSCPSVSPSLVPRLRYQIEMHYSPD